MAVRSGYPPRSLTIVPELPLSSLGLMQGEQIIVSQKAGAAVRTLSSPPNNSPAVSASTRISAPASVAPVSGSSLRAGFSSGASSASSNAAKETSEPDSVATEGGFLVHRVSLDVIYPVIAPCVTLTRVFILSVFHVCR